jgi:hypothetical protein
VEAFIREGKDDCIEDSEEYDIGVFIFEELCNRIPHMINYYLFELPELEQSEIRIERKSTVEVITLWESQKLLA